MARPKKNNKGMELVKDFPPVKKSMLEDQKEYVWTTEVETTKPKKERKPAVIIEIERLKVDFASTYNRQPTTLNLNHGHYASLLKMGARHYTTIHPSTQRIDKILGMAYYLDHGEEEMSVR